MCGDFLVIYYGVDTKYFSMFLTLPPPKDKNCNDGGMDDFDDDVDEDEDDQTMLASQLMLDLSVKIAALEEEMSKMPKGGIVRYSSGGGVNNVNASVPLVVEHKTSISSGPVGESVGSSSRSVTASPVYELDLSQFLTDGDDYSSQEPKQENDEISIVEIL